MFLYTCAPQCCLAKAQCSLSMSLSMSPLHTQSQSQYNWSQRAIIDSAVSCACEPYSMPRMVLLQGPPGTGKTHTIVGLVKSFFEVGRATHLSYCT